MFSSLQRTLLSLIKSPGIRNTLLLLVLLFAARYWYWYRFGLYEDDLSIIPGAMQMNFSELSNFVVDYFAQFKGQGRPFHHSLIYIFSNLGYNLGGLNGPYLIGFAILGLNSVLFYLLMRRAAGNGFALVSGLAYILFSADTTQSYLTHALGLHPAITFLLLACHAYLSNRRWLAYPLALMVLFIYETPFFVFLGVPLLKKVWDRRLLREWLLHLAILVALAAGVHLFRAALGEAGVIQLSLLEMARLALEHSLVGPLTSLASYVTRPFEWLGLLTPQLALVVLLSWLMAGLALHFLLPLKPPLEKDAAPQARPRFNLSENAKFWLRLLAAGLLMLVCAYPLTFTTPPDALLGRATRVHSAAVVGAAVVIGALVALLLNALRGIRWQRLAAWLVCAWFALLVGFGFTLQMDYVWNWTAEQRFWTTLLPMIADAGENTSILVEPNVFPYESYQIAANEWNLPRTLNQIYQYPAEWQDPPRVFRLKVGWDQHILTADGRINIGNDTVYSPPGYWKTVDSTQVILIQAGNPPYRRNQDLAMGDFVLPLKAPSDPLTPGLPKGFLYQYLILDQP